MSSGPSRPHTFELTADGENGVDISPAIIDALPGDTLTFVFVNFAIDNLAIEAWRDRLNLTEELVGRPAMVANDTYVILAKAAKHTYEILLERDGPTGKTGRIRVGSTGGD